MGFHRLMQRGTQVSFGIMLRFVTIAALATVAASSHEMMKKIHKDMMVMNSMTACWGKGNMMLYKMAVWEATEECMQENHSNLLKPANPDPEPPEPEPGGRDPPLPRQQQQPL